ncbi:MAG TPA: prepilin-type N-terminal cleavage/methylation domain-containing protein [Actinomycetota bacterium]|nr:prepilin-type N-terminal cleavage/methylation domain-containing protein [Actinomycetota bacterium]
MTARREDGYTLVEVLFAFFLLSILTGGFYVLLFSQQRSANVARSIASISEETRLGFARMVRDTREGDVLTDATPTSYTVKVNFDGDSLYENPNQNDDDEILTFSYDAAAKTISVNGSVLMRGVEPIPGRDLFSYSSNNLEYDWGNDGTTTWQDLDDAAAHGITGVGSNPPNAQLDAEVPNLTAVTFALRVSDSGRHEDFTSTAQMRNRL